MIAEIMKSINNHFARSIESKDYEIVADGIVGSFTESYVAGQYVWITGSLINDGVYKLTAVASNKLTTEEALMPENTSNTLICVYGLAVPRDFLQLVTDIETWAAKNVGKEGVASESIDSYSISFADGGKGASWINAFSSRLSRYRRMYDDDKRLKYSTLNWQRRDYGGY